MRNYLYILLLSIPLVAKAQTTEWSAFDGITTQYEIQGSVSSSQTPLWLNANKYGLSSLASANGYLRAGLSRDINRDKDKTIGLGYGCDFVLPYNHTTEYIIQQLFAEIKYSVFTLGIGSKNRPLEQKNTRLSSGGQALGINARPVPQARISIEDYWTVPFTKQWLSIKGHLSYGYMTDGKWQKKFTGGNKKWTDGALYHSKAGYFRIGKDGRPFNVVLGLEMATIFGGKVHWIDENNEPMILNGSQSMKAFWNAFFPGGEDFREKEQGYVNVEGDQLGSWTLRLNYSHTAFDIAVYADKFFEDHSALYNLGYYGYGKDGDWQKRSRRLYLYPLKDGMLGIELSLKNQNYLKTIVMEFMNTRYQSGPIYHDHNETIYDQIGGQDNYYNHTYYPGWQYYGMVIGNPLFLSPIYNNDWSLEIENNRFVAWYMGIEGEIMSRISYRLLTSWQKGLGTYREPYLRAKENTSFLAEMEYDISEFFSGLHLKVAYGFDRGKLLGNNDGLQITLTYIR